MKKKKFEEQLEKELLFHVEQHSADLIARGVEPSEALRRARLEIGGPEQVKEDCRDQRGARWLEDLWQDFRYALRNLQKNPGFTAVTLATLALGIGATTAMFTVVNGVLLKPLNYANPGRLLAVHGYSASWNVALFGRQYLAYPDFVDCRREARSVEMAGWVADSGTLSEPGEAEYVNFKEMSANTFSVLGVPLFRGRAFLPEEDRPGAAPVAILGYSFWQRAFARNPAALGMSLVLDGKRYTVVGIASPNFRLDEEEVELYRPVGQDTAAYLQGRRAHPVRVVARLHPGATLAQARTELDLMGRGLAEQYPATNRDRRFEVDPLRPAVGDVASMLWLLLGAVTLVLLIACVNVASLMLARAVSRERELAMRVALGAGRFRLVRQCLTESAVLGLAGGILGIAVATFAVKPFVAFWPDGLPRAEEVTLDWRVLAFALAVSLAGGFLFGLAPAFRVPARALEQALRAGAKNLAGSSRRIHSGFVVCEIALAVILLVAAGMLGRAMLRLASLDPGVNVRNVLTARMALSPATLTSPARIRAGWEDVLNRARTVPGIEAVAMVDMVPMRPGNNPIGYWTTGAVPPEGQRPLALSTCASPDYMKVMGIRLREGRFLSEQDRIDSRPVVVIDDVMAQSAFGRGPVTGKQIWIPDLGPGPFDIVGVAEHIRYWGPAGDDQAKVRAQFYYPFAQVADPLLRRWSQLMSIAVRTTVPPLGVVQPLRTALRGASNDQVLYEVRTLERLAANSVATQRFLLLIFGVFAGLSLLLASIGIYGVLAYLTTQRVREFGVRMALGATAGDVIGMVFRQSLGMIAGGVLLGLAGAAAAGQVLKRLVEGIGSTGPETFAVMIAVLVAAALFASFLPARRAGRVDPIRALRQD